MSINKTKAISLLISVMLIVMPMNVGGQNKQTPVTVWDTPTVTLTTATADTTATNTMGMHKAEVQIKFGTVTGTYSTCTVQPKTSISGTVDYLTLGSTISITITTGTINRFTVEEPGGITASSTAAAGFGAYTKFNLACSSYGTTAPATINVIYSPFSSIAGVLGPQPAASSASVTVVGTDNFASSQVTVANTATSVVSQRTRRGVIITIGPTANQNVFCGPTSGVTISTGDMIIGTSGAGKYYETNSAIFCIVTSSTQVVTVAEIF